MLRPVDGALWLTVKSESKSESDTAADLLDHKLDSSIDYQRQGDTIITWCDPETQIDLALSFQEVERCVEVWARVLEIKAQGDDLAANEDRMFSASEEVDCSR